MDAIKINIYRSSPDLELPQYKTNGSVGLDLLASTDGIVRIEPGAHEMIPTGLFLEIPSGYEGQVRPRSGLAAKYGVTVLNTPGTIDSDYRGEVKVILINHGSQPFTVRRGDRIAQIVFAPISRIEWIEVESLAETERGSGGFGHTGMI